MSDAKDPKQREVPLHEQLSTAPTLELVGIVSPSGVSGGQMGGETLWMLSFSFDAWRVNGGPIHEESLKIFQRVEDRELQRIQSAILAETIVRIRARLVEDKQLRVAQADPEDYLGLAEDEELMARLEESRKPREFRDPQFDVFRFDRRGRTYSATNQWVGIAIELTLNAETPNEIESCLQVARELWSQKTSWKTRIDSYAASQLLPLKNEAWLEDEDEDEVSSDEFKSRMRLETISIYPDGTFEFWHDDGDLFWGHVICVSGNVSDGPNDAGIAG